AHHLSHISEIDAAAALAVVSQKPGAPFFREARGAHSLGDAERFESLVGGGEERLADVKSRERVALEQDDGVALLPERDRRRRTRGPASGDGKIKVVGHCRAKYSGSLTRVCGVLRSILVNSLSAVLALLLVPSVAMAEESYTRATAIA